MLNEFRSTFITWDKATSRIYSPITANASDENGRKLVVQIVNSGQVEDLTGATLHLYWETRDKAHDGLDVFEAVDLKKGEFELSYTTGMLSNQGVLNANLVLIDTVGRVVSDRFKITVTEGIDNDAIQSENSFSSLTQALIDISNLEQNYAPRLNDLTAQLADKANVEYVNVKLNSIASGSPKKTFPTLALLQSDIIANTLDGKKSIYVVTEDGNWYYWNGVEWESGGVYQSTKLDDSSVKPVNIYGSNVSTEDLFLNTTLTKGYVQTTATGLTANEMYSITDYIEVIGGEKITLSVTEAVFASYFNHNKVWIASVRNSGSNFTSTVPPNAFFVRYNILNTNIPATKIYRGTSIPQYDEKSKLSWLTLNDNSVSQENIVKKVNLYNYKTTIDNKVIALPTGEITTNEYYSLSDFIEVKPLTKYICSWANTTLYSFYDKSKSFLGISPSVAKYTDNYSFTTPSNAYFIRINVYTHSKKHEDFILYEGDVLPTNASPYATLEWLKLKDGSVTYDSLENEVKTKLNKAGIIEDGAVTMDALSQNVRDAVMGIEPIATTSKWYNKTFVTFGDSITWYDGQTYNAGNKEYGTLVRGYQTHMREKLGATVINQGVSGYRMPQVYTKVIAQNYEGVDAVTITAGANDFRVSEEVEPFGNIQPIGSNFDNTSFVGALQSSIEYILSKNKEIKIYILMPIKGWNGPSNDEMPSAYPDAMKEVAKIYSLSICEWYYTSGINKINKDTYIGDIDTVGAYLHPSTKGYERMANILIPFLENN